MPIKPKLVGYIEAAEMLGITPQCLGNWIARRRGRNRPPFPKPLVYLAMGPVWDAKDIMMFDREKKRNERKARIPHG